MRPVRQCNKTSRGCTCGSFYLSRQRTRQGSGQWARGTEFMREMKAVLNEKQTSEAGNASCVGYGDVVDPLINKMLDKITRNFSAAEVHWLRFSPTNTSRPESSKPKPASIRLGLLSQIPAASWEGWNFRQCYRVLRARVSPTGQTQSSGGGNTSRSEIIVLAISLTARTAARMRQLLRGLISLFLQMHDALRCPLLAALTSRLDTDAEMISPSDPEAEAAAATALMNFWVTAGSQTQS